MHKNKKRGFSLAEAMITILIIGIISLLSVPVAKKMVRKDNNPNKGTWMATRNSNGEAVYWKKGMGNKDNPDKWTKCNTTCEINGQTVSDCCVFDSPLNVRNFSLTAVGGGGGGAGASNENFVRQESIRVDYPGLYKMVAVGGGGSGGRWNCTASGNKNAGTGGAGGLGYAEFEIGDDVKEIRMKAGSKGPINSGDNYHGSAGGDSRIWVIYTNEKEKDLIVAHGGGAGQGRWSPCTGRDDNGHGGAGGSVSIDSSGKNQEKSVVNGKDYKKPTDSDKYVEHDRALLKSINEKIGKTVLLRIGEGRFQVGSGGQTSEKGARQNYTEGGDGAVAISTAMTVVGYGGNAGDIGEEFVPKFETGQVVVYIGKGGIGGQAGTTVKEEDADALGKDGGDTYVGTKVYRGGKGGGFKSAYGGKSANGGNGSVSPIPSRTAPGVILGGLSDSSGNLNTQGSVNGEKAGGYGAGGGGGGIFVNSSSGDVEVGSGGDGAPGYVQITW